MNLAAETSKGSTKHKLSMIRHLWVRFVWQKSTREGRKKRLVESTKSTDLQTELVITMQSKPAEILICECIMSLDLFES